MSCISCLIWLWLNYAPLFSCWFKVCPTYQISSVLTLIRLCLCLPHAHKTRNPGHTLLLGVLESPLRFYVRNWWSCSYVLTLMKCRLCCHPSGTRFWKCGLALLLNDCFWHSWITVIMGCLLSLLIAVVEQHQYYHTFTAKYTNIAHDLAAIDDIKT